MRHMLLAAAALAMLNGAAYAQNSTSGSNSMATNSSASQSQSISSPRVNVFGNPIGNGASSSNSSAGATANTRSSSQSSAVGNRSTVVVNTYAGVDSSGNSSSGAGARVGGGSAGGSGSGANGANGTNAVDPAGLNGLNGTTGADPAYNVHYSGGYSVQNVPEVIPPSINGGNPCAVGASGGLSVSGFGIAGGATWADKQCERRQQAALLYNIGRTNAAVELMCQDDNVRAALRASGEPCTADRVAASPAPAGAVAPLPAVVATPMPAKPKPEWCARARPTTEASKAYVAQQCDA